MTGKEELSKTMRIDLIPDISDEMEGGGKERVIITTPPPQAGLVSPRFAADADATPYQELLQSIYDAVLIAEPAGRIVDANARAVEFLRYDRAELLSLTILDIVSGSDESLTRTLWDNLEHDRFTLIQAYCVRKDGSYFPAEIAVNKLQLDGLHLCCFVRDITLRRQAEEMLRTEHNAIQNAGNGIAVADVGARLEYVNPAVVTMWGMRDAESVVGTDVRTLLGTADEVETMLSAVLRDLVPWTGEVATRRHDNGVEFHVQISAAPNRNSDGEPVGVVLSFVDTSDRQRAERAMRETERQRVMLESLGAACHHLGQPATILLANVGILKRKLEGINDDVVVELVQSSHEAAETLGEILHKLLAVNTYKTVPYLEKDERNQSGREDRILDI